MTERDITQDPAAHALALAALLDGAEEHTLGPTDSGLCAEALRCFAVLIDAGLACPATRGP